MYPVILPKVLTAGVVAGISLSQSGTAGTPLTLNGSLLSGASTLDTQRRLQFTFSSSEAANSYTITGTRQTGQTIQEVLVGTLASASTALDYYTVNSIVPTINSSAAVAVGTNAVGSSPWVMPNYNITPFNLDIGVVVSGSVTFSVQYTFDDYVTVPPNNTIPAAPTPWELSALSAKAVNTDGSFTQPIRGWRLTVLTGTGTATATGIQAGIRN